VSGFTFPFLYLPFCCFFDNFFLLPASVHLASAVAMQNVSELKKCLPKNIHKKQQLERKTLYFFAITMRGNFRRRGLHFPGILLTRADNNFMLTQRTLLLCVFCALFCKVLLKRS